MKPFAMSIRTQLTVFIAILLAMMVGVAGLAAVRFSEADRAAQELSGKWLKAQFLLSEVRIALVRLRGTEIYVTFVPYQYSETAANMATTQRSDLEARLQTYFDEVERTPDDIETDSFRSKVESYLERSNLWSVAPELRGEMFFDSLSSYLEIAKELQDQIAQIQMTADNTSRGIRALLRQATIVMVGMMIVGVLAGLLLLMRVRVGITEPLARITDALSRLASGDCDAQVPGKNQRNEIGRMARAFEVFRANAVALDVARKEAVAASTSKSAFLANMSHEIRTPLNGIMGMAQVLEATNLDPHQRELVATVLQSGGVLTALLNDVLDLSKIEAGKLDIVSTDANLHEVMRRQHRLWKPRAEEKGLDLSLAMDVDLPDLLAFDAVRVQQCVANLVSNAIKFTDAGSVGVHVAAARRTDGCCLVTIRIKDTGPGIAEEASARLFKPFTQADESIQRVHGGSGLGLSITRRLAEMMGGEATVDSTLGEGSTFTFSFLASPPSQRPAAQAPTPPVEAAQQAADQRGKRVLLVDDHPINRQVVNLFLRPYRMHVVEAANGVEALEALARETFDIVLLDMHMPVMDGPTTIRTIRASDQPWSGIKVIALTADAMSGDRERYLGMGMDGYLAKPLSERDLRSEMARVCEGSPDRAAVA